MHWIPTVYIILVQMLGTLSKTEAFAFIELLEEETDSKQLIQVKIKLSTFLLLKITNLFLHCPTHLAKKKQLLFINKYKVPRYLERRDNISYIFIGLS